MTIDPAQINFLIVDDLDNMRRSIRAMLKLIKFGRKYYEAANGLEAWEILNTEHCAIKFIISDWQMPKLNGTELLNKLRGNKKFKDTPFLMITAEANQSIVAEAAEQDVDAYLTKPFVTATLEQKILELLNRVANPTPQALLLRKADKWRAKGQFDNAIECLRRAADLSKHSSRPWREIGRLFLKKNDLPGAVEAFEQAITMNRLEVPSYHYLGQIYLKQGKTDKAIKYFTKALDLSPRNAERAFKVAALLLKHKRVKEAEKILKSMLRNNPDNLDLHEEAVDLAMEHGLFKLAVFCCRKVMEAAPERDYMQKKLGLALLRKGAYQEAAALLEKVQQHFPMDINVLLYLAECYLKLKMRMRADKWASKAVRIDPGNKLAQEILAQC